MDGFVILLACTGALIGGINNKEPKGYSQWLIEQDTCSVEYQGMNGISIIKVKCKNGELFMLPANQCSVSYLKKEK